MFKINLMLNFRDKILEMLQMKHSHTSSLLHPVLTIYQVHIDLHVLLTDRLM